MALWSAYTKDFHWPAPKIKEIGSITHKLEAIEEVSRPNGMLLDEDDEDDEDGDIPMMATLPRADQMEPEKEKWKLISKKKNALGSRKFMKNVRNLHLCLVSAKTFLVPNAIFQIIDRLCRFVGLTFSSIWEARLQSVYREQAMDLYSKIDEMRRRSVFTKERVFVNTFTRNVNIHALLALVDVHAYIKTPQSMFYPGFETQNNVSCPPIPFFVCLHGGN